MRFLNTLFLLAALSASSHAFAQNVFLVQLGSYKSEKEAESTWNSLKKENKTTLSDLFHQNSMIALPPSGAKVFRLQAGPFVTREEASSACNDLAQKGNDCFIVESAGFAPKESPLAIANAKAPAPVIAKEEKKKAEDTLVPAVLPAELPAANAGIIALAAAEKEAPAKIEVEKEDNSPTLFDRFTEAFSTSDVSDEKPVEKKAAPTVAVAKKKVATKSIEKAPKEPVAVVEKEITPKEETLVAEVDEPLPWKNLPKQKAVVKTAVVADSAPAKQKSNESLPEKLPFGRVGDAYAPIAAPSPVRAKLLPPPAIGDVQPSFSQNSEPAVVPVPSNAGDTKPRRLSQSDVIAPTDSRVSVDEAIPVPLSDRASKPAELKDTPFKAEGKDKDGTGVKEPVLSGKSALALRASPSRSLLQQSYWVQLNYFKNEQAALNQWQILSQKMPNLSRQMRVRVIKPYISHSLESRVSLQVGPFLSTADVSQLCDFAASETIRCSMGKDIGVSTAANQPRSRDTQTGYLQRRNMVNLRPGASAQYWVQLGSYHSRGDASKAWEELRMQHTALQSHLPTVSQPALSSSPEPVHRLRTGPFQIRYAAQELCDQLRNQGASCLVLGE